jgi:transposase
LKQVFVFERKIGKYRYRIAAQSVRDPRTGKPVSRQVVLGPADPSPLVDLSRSHTVGHARIGDVGALVWVAEQLDLVGHINRACPAGAGARSGPSLGEMALGVAVQRACVPGAKRDLPALLGTSLPRVSCLPAESFTGQAFHRLAASVTDEELDAAQLAIARAAVARFQLSVDVLAFDTTNFDTHIATTTTSSLARRGHAKSKRSDLRVVGLGILASETGHVPLLHRTYPGNSSDQAVLTSCLTALGTLHDTLGEAQGRPKAERTVVRDGGFWSEQLELDLAAVGYFSVISLPLGHGASSRALEHAAKRGAMKPLGGALRGVRAARLVERVGELSRTLVVVESEELLRGQKRGIAVALRKAQVELRKLASRAEAGRIDRTALERRVQQTLAREHLSSFVVARIGSAGDRLSLKWEVDEARRRELERTRLGRRVISTNRDAWSTERIILAFRGQWNVEELFRRAKKGGVAPWGPSFQWTDASLRLHTFATVMGLMLVSLAKVALRSKKSARGMMQELAAIEATLLRTSTGKMGRRPTVMVPSELAPAQRRAVNVFQLDRWLPALSSTTAIARPKTGNPRVA